MKSSQNIHARSVSEAKVINKCRVGGGGRRGCCVRLVGKGELEYLQLLTDHV